MRRVDPRLGDYEFALCLTHDVDRPEKSLRSLYYALGGRPGYHLGTLLSRENPYWQFEEIMALEDELGVRSAFYFLDEPDLLREGSVPDWLSVRNWVQYLGRYDVTAPRIADLIEDLDAGGWEVGLHGSILAHDDPDRLAAEKESIESVLGHEITGGRQHYLTIDGRQTWRNYADLGLAYDTSLGSSTEVGFRHGYRPFRPFDDGFVEFPLTAMEVALPDPATANSKPATGKPGPGAGNAEPGAAWRKCEQLLAEAAENDAVMTVLWHPRYFSETEFPGYRRLYRRLVERALEMGAWVGPPAQLYDRLEVPGVETA